MDKLPNYFKRNKMFLMCWLPFLIITFGILVFCSAMSRDLDAERYYFSISRIVFCLLYTIVMHMFLHKTEGIFSKYEFDNSKIKKRDKVINSILIILPIFIILLTSILHIWDNSYIYLYINIFELESSLLLLDLFLSVNATLFTIFAIRMYIKDKLNIKKDNKELSPNNNQNVDNENSEDRIKAKKKINNKRRIAMAFIWRYALLIGITIFLAIGLSSFVGRVVNSNTDELFDIELHSLMEQITSTLYLRIPLLITFAISFFVMILIGSMIINKIVAKKIVVEEQNKKFIKRSFSLFLLLVLLGSICFNVSYFEYSNIDKVKSSVQDELDMYYDMRDFWSQAPSSQSDTVIPSMDAISKNFDINKMMDFYYKFLIPFGIICGLGSVILTIIIWHNYYRLINKICVSNTLDNSGNVVPTQERYPREYIKMIIITSIINVVVLASIFIVYKIKTYEQPKYGNHVLLENGHYSEYSLVDKNENEEKEVNNSSGDNDDEYLNEIKELEHEDNWYLENEITIFEAYNYRSAHPEYSGNKDYILSKYDEAKKLSEKIKEYKNLGEIETALGIKFAHTDVKKWTTILDGKNLLTGVGVEVVTDSFSDKNILDTKIYDLYGIIKEYEKKQKLDSLKIDIEDLRDKINLLYEDMTIDDVIVVLGEEYIHEKEITSSNYKYDYYTWYDKTGSYLTIEFSNGVIHLTTFWNNNPSYVSKISQDEMEKYLGIKFSEPEKNDYYNDKCYYDDELNNENEIDVKYRINDIKTKFSLVLDDELKEHLKEKGFVYEIDDSTFTIIFPEWYSTTKAIYQLERNIKYNDEEELLGDIVTYGNRFIITSDGIAHYINFDFHYEVIIEEKTKNRVVAVGYDKYNTAFFKEEDGLIEEAYNGIRRFDIEKEYINKLLSGDYMLLNAVDSKGKDITNIINTKVPKCIYDGSSLVFHDNNDSYVREMTVEDENGLEQKISLGMISSSLKSELNKFDTYRDSSIAYYYYDISDDDIELKIYLINGDIYTYSREI